jgi:hypothetical protein
MKGRLIYARWLVAAECLAVAAIICSAVYRRRR